MVKLCQRIRHNLAQSLKPPIIYHPPPPHKLPPPFPEKLDAPQLCQVFGGGVGRQANPSRPKISPAPGRAEHCWWQRGGGEGGGAEDEGEGIVVAIELV